MLKMQFNPTGKSGVYGGYQDWIDRPGRFRSWVMVKLILKQFSQS